LDQSAEPSAVLLIAHGSRRESANADLRELAGRLAAQGRWRIVVPSFLELAEPDVTAGAALCIAAGATRVLMVPYFLSAGVHLLRDLTAARDDLRARHPGATFVLGPPLGPHPLLDRLVLARVEELAEGVGEVVDPAEEAALLYRPMEDWTGRTGAAGRINEGGGLARLDEISEKD